MLCLKKPAGSAASWPFPGFLRPSAFLWRTPRVTAKKWSQRQLSEVLCKRDSLIERRSLKQQKNKTGCHWSHSTWFFLLKMNKNTSCWSLTSDAGVTFCFFKFCMQSLFNCRDKKTQFLFPFDFAYSQTLFCPTSNFIPLNLLKLICTSELVEHLHSDSNKGEQVAALKSPHMFEEIFE